MHGALLAYLRVVEPHAPALLEEYVTGAAAIQRAKWKMVGYRSKPGTYDRFARPLFVRPAFATDSERPDHASSQLLRVEFLVGDADFPSSRRGELSVPIKSVMRELVRVAQRHNAPVRFQPPVNEWRTTKACCACGAVTTPVGMRLRRCRSSLCNPPGGGGGGGRATRAAATGGAAASGTAPAAGGAAPAAGGTAPAAGEDEEDEEGVVDDSNDAVLDKPAAGPSPRPKKGSGKLRHRDVNAARNMLMLCFNQEAGAGRPPWLTPPQRLKQKIQPCPHH